MIKQIFYTGNKEAGDVLQQKLLLIAGLQYCSFAVMNRISKKMTAFGYYTSEGNDGMLPTLFELHPELNNLFFQSSIAFDVAEAVQVPDPYYKYEEVKDHLELVCGPDEGCTLVSEHLPAWKIYNAYRLPAGVHSFISRRFTGGHSWHLASVKLKSISMETADAVYADFKTTELSVIVCKDKTLQLVQTFNYTTPEDVLYYLLKIYQQFSLSQNEVKLMISGLIEKDSALYKELYKYFIYPEFEMAGNELIPGENFGAYPAHYFSSLSKLAACVS